MDSIYKVKIVQVFDNIKYHLRRSKGEIPEKSKMKKSIFEPCKTRGSKEVQNLFKNKMITDDTHVQIMPFKAV